MAEENKIPAYDAASIFGKWNAPTPEERAVDMRISDMLQAQWKQAAINRTDAAKMAQVNALGNVLQTVFAPVGWGAAGGNATAQTATPDNRAYISAFNNAIKADNDFRNLGVQQQQFLLQRDMERAKEAQAWRQSQAEAESKQAAWERQQAIRQADELEKINARNQWRRDIEQMKADLRVKYQSYIKSSGGKSIDEKLFLGAVKDAQSAYKTIKWRKDSGLLPEEFELPTFKQFFSDMFPEWEGQYDSYIKEDRKVRHADGL